MHPIEQYCPKGFEHPPPSSLSSRCLAKGSRIFSKLFSDILTWGKGLGQNVLLQFSTLGGSKMEITLQRLFDQSQVHPYRWENATCPGVLGLFGHIRVPYPKGLNYWLNPL